MLKSTRRLSRRALVLAAGAAVVARPRLAAAQIARKAKITYWTPLDPKAKNARSLAEAEMIKIFRDRHPDIEVDVQPVPWQVMGQQVIQAVLAGSGPDVAQLSTTNLPDQVAARTTAPLNDIVGKRWSRAEKDDFLLPWENVTYDGQLMAVYWNSLLGNQLWYLKNELAGEPPSQWHKFAEFLQAPSARLGVTGFMTGLSQQGNAIEFTNWFIPALWACGGDYVTKSGELGFVNDTGVKAFEWLVDLVQKYKVTPASIVSVTRDNILDTFRARKALTTLLSSNIISSARASLGQDFALGFQPGPDGPCKAFATGKFLIVSRTSKEREAAGLFIESLVSPEAQLANAKIASEPPARKSVLKDPWFSTPEAADIRFVLEYLAKHPHEFKYPQHTDYLQTQLALAAQQIVSGKQKIQDALRELAGKWEAKRRA